MPSRPATTIPPERIAAYDRVIAALPGLERKGATVPYTSVNGRMTSYLGEGGGLALRLPPDERRRFMEQYGAELQVAYGHPQPEFVAVPDAILEDTAALAPWFAAGYAWMAARPPKPTTRKAEGVVRLTGLSQRTTGGLSCDPCRGLAGNSAAWGPWCSKSRRVD